MFGWAAHFQDLMLASQWRRWQSSLQRVWTAAQGLLCGPAAHGSSVGATSVAPVQDRPGNSQSLSHKGPVELNGEEENAQSWLHIYTMGRGYKKEQAA